MNAQVVTYIMGLMRDKERSVPPGHGRRGRLPIHKPAYETGHLKRIHDPGSRIVQQQHIGWHCLASVLVEVQATRKLVVMHTFIVAA